MTLTTLLSARIRELEERAAPLADHRDELFEIEERRAQLHVAIERAEAAAYQLDLIGLQVEQVLSGGPMRVEITGGLDLIEGDMMPVPAHLYPEPEDAPKVPDVPALEPVVVDTVPADPKPETTQGLTITEQVLRYVGQNPGCSAVAVAESTGLKLSSVAPALSALHRRGDLAHDGGKPMLYRLAGSEQEAEAELDPQPGLTDDQSHLLGIFSDGALYNESILQIRTKWPATRVFRSLQALRMLNLVEKRHSSYVIVRQEQRATA